MASQLNMQQTLKQTHKITPKQQFDLQVLKANQVELNALLKEEMENNPLLEYDETYYGSSFDQSSYLESIASEISLQDELLYQLHTYPSYINNKIAKYLIEALDDHGHFTQDLNEVGKLLSVSMQEIVDTLKIIQTFSPSGIGGKDAFEGLLIQLINDGYEENDLVYQLAKDHLLDIAKQNYQKLAHLFAISEDELLDEIAIIKLLNPNPTSGYVKEPAMRCPDLKIEIIENKITVVLETCTKYYKVVVDHFESLDTSTSKYINNHQQRIERLFSSIKKRDQTLLKIMEIMTDYQKTFFLENKPLKKLRMMDIAKILALSNSTISRAIDGKLCEFNHTYYPLKFFFCLGVSSGESSDEIKQQIQILIKKEDHSTPYSDQALMDILNENNYQVKRRTVTKYREALRLPSSNKRKV